MARLFVTEGDITHMKKHIQAIATLVNSGGMWFGGVDRAICRISGQYYYAQLAKHDHLVNGQTFVAVGDHKIHGGSFDNVIFVVDDLVSPLHSLVHDALIKASNEGYKSVALPLMRSGVMKGAVEPNLKTVVKEMRKGIELALADGADKMDIYIVVYDEPEAVKLFDDGSMKLLN